MTKQEDDGLVDLDSLDQGDETPEEKEEGLKKLREQIKRKSEQQRIDLDNKIDDLDKRFIFDPNKVHRLVPFPLFKINSSLIGLGMTLPAPKIVRDSKGHFLGTSQINEAVIIVSNGEWINVNVQTAGNFGVRFNEVPDDYPRRWSLPSIKHFLLKPNSKKVDPKKVFEKIKSQYEKYVYQADEWHMVHTLWDMSTYFSQLFHAFPYLELRGLKQTGKSKIMELSSRFSFNATDMMTNPSTATLFRDTDAKRSTTYIDEAENLFKIVKGRVEPDERVEVLNSGYRYTGSVPRQEKIGNKFITRIYYTYSPKMIASINGLRGATESRAIVHVTKRAPNDDKRGELEINNDDDSFQKTRDNLYWMLMQQWKTVLEIYESLSTNNETGLKKRDFQLWRPLLSVAKIIDEEVYKKTVIFACKQSDLSKFDELSEGSYEFFMLKKFYELLVAGEQFVLVSNLLSSLPDDSKMSSRGAANIIDKLGFRDYKERRKNGTGYVITKTDFEMLIMPVAPSIINNAEPITDLSKYSSNPLLVVNDERVPNRDELLFENICRLYNSRDKKPLEVASLQAMNGYITDDLINKWKETGVIAFVKPGMVVPIV